MASASWRRWLEGQVQHKVGHVARVHVAQAGGLGGGLAGGGEQRGHLVPVDDPVGAAAPQRRAAAQADLGDLPAGRLARRWAAARRRARSPRRCLAVDDAG